MGLDRTTGLGRVRAADGDYADALAKGYGLALLCSETSGAVSPVFDATLRRNARLARAPDTTDHTRYGASPSSPQDYYNHHLAAHSSAVVFADVDSILTGAATQNFFLARHG